jgi:hypothetical protein
LADRTNRKLRIANPEDYAGKHIHEIQPINFAGNPTDPANKIPLSPEDHYLLNVWWGRIKRGLLKDSGTNRG